MTTEPILAIIFYQSIEAFITGIVLVGIFALAFRIFKIRSITINRDSDR